MSLKFPIRLALAIIAIATTSCGLDPVWVDPPECMNDSKKKAIEIEEFSFSSKCHTYRSVKEYRFVFWVKLIF